jgi:hypothetical protein
MERVMWRILRVLLTFGVVVAVAAGCQRNAPEVAKVSPEEARPSIAASPTPAVKETPSLAARPEAEPPKSSPLPARDRALPGTLRSSQQPVIRPRKTYETVTLGAGTGLKVQAVDSLVSGFSPTSRSA